MSRATRAMQLVTVIGAFLFLTAAPGQAQLAIDTFLDPFPPNPDLPASGREMIFVGSYCDGNVCPPGAIVTHATDDACSQTGLPGVLGGERAAHIVQFGTGNGDSGPGYGYLCLNHSSFGSTKLFIDYGVTTDMNTDLTLGLATAIRVDATGDMYAGPRPVPLRITVTSGRGTAGETSATVSQNLVLDGTYTYPFASFTGVDFTDVDAVSLELDASAVQAVDLCIYNFQTNGTPVGVESISFGHLKTLYR